MKKILLFSILSFFIFSCEDPIDVDVADAPAQVVVDAFLNNQNVLQEINLSYTRPIFQASTGAAITDAEVTVENTRLNNVMNFVHEGNGKYTFLPSGSTNNIGEVGDIFNLEISHGPEKYTATAVLNRVPEIDSINQELRENEILGPDGLYCQFFATDLEGLGDSYWIKTYKNGVFLNRPVEMNLAFDAGFDSGTPIDNITFIPPIRELTNPVDDELLAIPYVPGDSVFVEIHSISNETFFFMETVRDQLLNSLNGIFAEPLANANGNIVNENGEAEVLGMFNVAAISTGKYIVE